MSTTIARIENAGPDLRARRLIFADGTPSRTTSAAAVKELGIGEGVPVAPEALDEALAEVETRLAKDRALGLLGYHDHSANELERKLLDNGYPRKVASAVVARFVEVQLVDDVRFASSWVRSRRASGYGTRRIRQELERKGIEPETIETALAEEESQEDDELARARTALGSRTASDRKGRDKLIRRLVGRGFSLSIAIGAVDEAGAASDDMDTPSELR